MLAVADQPGCSFMKQMQCTRTDYADDCEGDRRMSQPRRRGFGETAAASHTDLRTAG